MKAPVVVPNFDMRQTKVWGALCIPDNEVKLDRRVERTCPHVMLFGGLSTRENIGNQEILICVNRLEFTKTTDVTNIRVSIK